MDLERLNARKELIAVEVGKFKEGDNSLNPGVCLDEETIRGLDETSRGQLLRTYELSEEYRALYDQYEDPLRDPDARNRFLELRLEIRSLVEELVLAGMLRFHFVQEKAIFFGAIPDPDTSFRFFRGTEGFYCCWDCGDEANVKLAFLSVRLDQIPHSGPGIVITRKRAWCPSCEPEPADAGIIRLSELTTEEAAGVAIARLEFNSQPDVL